MGISGSKLYNCALSVYHVSVIKFGVQEKTFKKKIDFGVTSSPMSLPWESQSFYKLEGTLTLWMVSHSMISYYFEPVLIRSDSNTFRHAFPPEDANCWLSAVPKECLHDPDVDCTRGEKNALVYRKNGLMYVCSHDR